MTRFFDLFLTFTLIFSLHQNARGSLHGVRSWEPYSSAPVGSVRHNAGLSAGVVQLSHMVPSKIPGRTALAVNTCGTFVLDEDHIMTNAHCRTVRQPRIDATFNFTNNPHQHQNSSCQSFVGGNNQLDYAIIKCPGIGRSRQAKPVVLDPTPLRMGERLFSVAHHCGEPGTLDCKHAKLISPMTVIRKENGMPVEFREGYNPTIEEMGITTGTTISGMSGSGVYSENTGVVRGILNSKYKSRSYYGTFIGSGFIPAHLLVADIQKRFPEIKLRLTTDQQTPVHIAQKPAAQPPRAPAALASLPPVAAAPGKICDLTESDARAMGSQTAELFERISRKISSSFL